MKSCCGGERPTNAQNLCEADIKLFATRTCPVHCHETTKADGLIIRIRAVLSTCSSSTPKPPQLKRLCSDVSHLVPCPGASPDRRRAVSIKDLASSHIDPPSRASSMAACGVQECGTQSELLESTGCRLGCRQLRGKATALPHTCQAASLPAF